MTDQPSGVAAPPPPPPSVLAGADRAPVRRVERAVPRIGPGQLAALVAAAVAADIALHQHGPAVAASASVVALAAALWKLGASERREARSLLVGAVVFGCWLSLRASPWLAALNTVAGASLLIGAALRAHPLHRHLGTSTLVRLLRRIFLARLAGRVIAQAPLPRGRAGIVIPVVRGVTIAVVPLVILWTLLSTADVVFADSLAWEVDLGTAIGHVTLTLVAFAAGTCVVAMATEPVAGPQRDRRPLGQIEAIILLGGIAVLFSAFAVVQLMGAFGDTEARLSELGVTPAEYARSGFFQLLWVAALTATILGVTRLLIEAGSSFADRVARILGALVSLLTCAIVAVAVVRLGHYNDAFGQTLLRWYSTAFAWMLGVGFVVIALAHSRRLDGIARLLPAVVVATLLAVNVINPEARVAEHNLTRDDATTDLDAAYLVGLSADAWPVILQHESLVTSRLRGQLAQVDFALEKACQRADRRAGYGPLGFNLATARLSCP